VSELTRIIEGASRGEPQAAAALLPMVYEELRRLAVHQMASERPGQTLQPTALVHEAYLRLVDVPQPQSWDGRGHFFAAAAEAMRRILIEKARSKMRQKRGGDLVRVDISDLDLAEEASDEQLLAVNEALDKLAAEDPEAAELIKLRFFVGLPNVEAAALLRIPERTAKRRWAYARAWMLAELRRGS
jgi:RNA polymerase sigma factor (TIGR02999 family)